MNNEKYNIEYFGKDNGSSFNKLFLFKVYFRHIWALILALKKTGFVTI